MLATVGGECIGHRFGELCVYGRRERRRVDRAGGPLWAQEDGVVGLVLRAPPPQRDAPLARQREQRSDQSAVAREAALVERARERLGAVELAARRWRGRPCRHAKEIKHDFEAFAAFGPGGALGGGDRGELRANAAVARARAD